MGYKNEEQSDKSDVLKKREEFAVTLRKKKHDELLQSKRKANMLKAF